MATYQLPDGRTVSTDMAFTLDEIQYPSNWLALSTPEDREERGIEGPLPEPTWYDQRFYWGPDQPKDHAQLVAQYSEYVRMNANAMLRETDWMVIREADTGKPCPAPIRTWREDIRNLVQTKTSAIDDCATVEELAAFVTGTNSEDPTSDYSYWPSAPEVDSVDPVCDYRSFYDALLISPAYVTIRTKAITNPAVLTACVEFIAAIGDAKSGRPNPAAIQACVDLLCAAAQFTAAELAELAEVMTVGGLDQFYTLPELEES